MVAFKPFPFRWDKAKETISAILHFYLNELSSDSDSLLHLRHGSHMESIVVLNSLISDQNLVIISQV